LSSINPETGDISMKGDIGRQGRPVGLLAANGAVWVGNAGSGQLFVGSQGGKRPPEAIGAPRLKPRAEAADLTADGSQLIAKMSPSDLATAQGSVFAVGGGSRYENSYVYWIERLPPARGATQEKLGSITYRRSDEKYCVPKSAHHSMVGGLGGLWITNKDRNTVTYISLMSDFSTTRRVTIPIDQRPHAIASGPDGVWVVSNRPSDPDQGLLTHITLRAKSGDSAIVHVGSIELEGNPTDVAYDLATDRVWVSAFDGIDSSPEGKLMWIDASEVPAEKDAEVQVDSAIPDVWKAKPGQSYCLH
jgi:DNA-binding beta-propeller fold protein YncE